MPQGAREAAIFTAVDLAWESVPAVVIVIIGIIARMLLMVAGKVT